MGLSIDHQSPKIALLGISTHCPLLNPITSLSCSLLTHLASELLPSMNLRFRSQSVSFSLLTLFLLLSLPSANLMSFSQSPEVQPYASQASLPRFPSKPPHFMRALLDLSPFCGFLLQIKLPVFNVFLNQMLQLYLSYNLFLSECPS